MNVYEYLAETVLQRRQAIVAEKMLKNGRTLEEIADITDLDYDCVEMLKEYYDTHTDPTNNDKTTESVVFSLTAAKESGKIETEEASEPGVSRKRKAAVKKSG